jgi:glycosyltransferase involved in cell wall biosynthesis
MHKPTITYHFPRSASFVEKDIRLLSSSFTVVPFDGKILKARDVIPLFFRQLLFLLQHKKAVAHVCMFAGYSTLLVCAWGKLTKTPVLLIVGGADAVSFPMFGYGNFRKKILGKVSALCYRWSAHVAPVSAALIEQKEPYFEAAGKQGYLFFVPDLTTPSTPIHNGYDAHFWKSHVTIERKTNRILTVATHVESTARKKIKGLDLFVEMARQFSTYEFVLVGSSSETFGECPSNLTFLPALPAEELVKVYSSAGYYAQWSVSEGFPNALCEAMLCGCIPLVSAAGAMPEIVGSSDWIIAKHDVTLYKKRLEEMLSVNTSAELREHFRNRIASLYTEEKRKNALIELLNRLIKEH